MIISPNQLEAVERLYKRGLNLQAYNLAQTIAPLPKWEGTDARILAANLAYNLGAPETSFRWTQNTWRKDKNHAKATMHFATDLFGSKGALPTLLFIRTKNPDFNGNTRLNVWWHCLYADVFANLRDFETAEKWLNKAFEIDSNDFWVWITKSHLLNLQDLYQESLSMAYKGLQIGGWRRSSVLATAHAFSLVERYDDALNLLTEANKHLESAWIYKELADLQSELGQHAEALENYERLFDFMPMREDAMEQWLYSRLATMAYLARDVRKAIRYAEISSTPLNAKFKETLQNLKGTEKRVQLKLGFVRQHEMTCAPATLSNISRYWQKKAEHLEVAEEICYDGTPAHSERRWAEKNGYKVREFTINWENVVELINRRVPISLTTVHPGNGHLQAIIGYDEIRRTFLIRDPYLQKIEEFLVDELLESQKATGPRGMALVPTEYANLLEGLNLKESRQYDYLFHIEDAFSKHNRPRAVELLEGMKREFPNHQLTWRAQWALASYDANHLQILEVIEHLRNEFPDDINLKMGYLSISQGNLRHEEMLKLLEDFSKSEKSHPLLWQMFGRDLSVDARQHSRAMRWLYRSLRCLPSNPTVYRAIANIYWSKRKFEDALELYRIAACLNDKNEDNAWSYFLAAQHLQQTEKALDFLKDRFQRFGHRSGFPAQTFFHALRQMGQNKEAFELLDEALKKRPNDAELKVFAAEAKARFGLLTEAKTLLNEAEKDSPRRDWLRTSATIAELEGELKAALSNWQEILQLEPLAMDAHQNAAFLLASTESRKSAQDYLKDVVKRFPHHRELHKYLLEWMQDEEAKEVLPLVRHLIEIDGRDGWSHREMARWLGREKRFEEALSEVETAYQLAPHEPVTHYTKATILTEMNRRQEAAEAYRQALTLSIDFTFALKNWLELARTREEKLNVLEFVKNELYRQTIFGDGLMGYYDFAKVHIESETLLNELNSLLEKRKDLWMAWSANICQLVDMKRLDEALTLAQKATARFPLTHQLWYDLSLVHKVKGESEAEIEALKTAINISPTWSYAIQQLSETYLRTGKKAEAKALLEDSLRRMPLDQYLHGYLADVLWQMEEKENAIETVKKALKLDSEYEWGWQSLKNWLRQMKRADEVEKMAWQVASAKPRDVNSWLTLARILDEPNQAEKQFEAINQALHLDEFNVRALALKVRNLSGRGLYDKALRVCQTRLPDGHQPELLQYCAAQVEFERKNYQIAVDMLEKLTISAPHFYAAWERLAEIYREIESKTPDYLRVTQAMTQLSPQDPVVFGYYGEACLFSNKREDAKKALHQAVALAPDYEFAAATLFDLHYEDREREQTISALQNLRQFIKNSITTVREMQFAVLEGNREEARKFWRELCLSPTAHRKHIERAIRTLRESKIFPEADKFISNTWKEFLRLPEANENIGIINVELSWDKNGANAAEKAIGEILVGSVAWREAVKVYLDLIAESNLKWKLHSFVKQNNKMLQGDNIAWASVGYTFNRLKDYKTAANWFSGWQTRQNVEPWMLWNYSLSLRRLGKDKEAREIHQAALNIEKDDTSNLHWTMLGLEDATDGKLNEAKNFARKIDKNLLNNWGEYFYYLLTMVLDIHDCSTQNLTKRDQLIKEMINFSLSQEALWSDNIKRKQFKKSLSKILSLDMSGWSKAKIQMKVLGSYLGYLLHKRI